MLHIHNSTTDHGACQLCANSECSLRQPVCTNNSRRVGHLGGHCLAFLAPAALHVSCSAVRDAAIECLEEVYRVYGEQLMDVLSTHQLRPAHLNLIYTRLAQLGADVTPADSHAGELSAACP